MSKVRRGQLASYGRVADLVNADHDLNIGARNVAWLRGVLYRRLGHDTDFPLHRIACKGDVNSLRDSPETKRFNDHLRGIFGESS